MAWLRLPLGFHTQIVCRQIRGQLYCRAQGRFPHKVFWVCSVAGGAMTITTSYLACDDGEAIDLADVVSDRIQAAEAALAQLTEPSRTISFVGCSDGPTATATGSAVSQKASRWNAPLASRRSSLEQGWNCGSRSERAAHPVGSSGLPAVGWNCLFWRM